MNVNELRRKRWVSVALLVGVIGVAGTTSFMVARSLNSGGTAQAGNVAAAPSPVPTQAGWPPYPPGQGPGRGPAYINPPGPDVTPIPGATPDTTQPWWYVPYENAEARKPRFQGVINGITITGDTVGIDLPCDTIEVKDLAAVEGTTLAVAPSYLPAGAIADFASRGQTSTFCNGVPASALARYVIVSDDSKWIRGGSITVYRYRAGSARIHIQAPADRWAAGTVGTVPAAVLAPILPDLGLGDSAIVWFQNGVVTVVSGSGIPATEMQRIAEGLLQ